MRELSKSLVYVSIAAFCYGVQPIFIKALIPFFSIAEQTMLRFVGGLLVFALIALFEEEELKRELKRWKIFVPAGILYGLAVIFWVSGNYMVMDAATVGILSRVNIVFIATISALLFIDEKRLLLSKRFFIGMLLAFIGAFGVVTAKTALSFELGFGVALIMLAHLFGGFYSAYLKSLANHKESATSLSIIFASSFFIALMFFFVQGNRPSELIQPLAFVPLISGMLGLGIGNYFYFKSIEEQGLVATSSMLLITPAITAFLSFIFLAEQIVAMQILWMLVLIFGCYFIINAEFGPLHLGRGIKREFKKALAHL